MCVLPKVWDKESKHVAAKPPIYNGGRGTGSQEGQKSPEKQYD
jgi:hypothetical protein